MQTFNCPYCGQEKEGSLPTEFARCRFCGFRSALVESESEGQLLIVDRKMPYLQRRCKDLTSQLAGVKIVVDRRVAQDPHDHPDRRRNRFDDDMGFVRSTRPGGIGMTARDLSSM